MSKKVAHEDACRCVLALIKRKPATIPELMLDSGLLENTVRYAVRKLVEAEKVVEHCRRPNRIGGMSPVYKSTEPENDPEPEPEPTPGKKPREPRERIKAPETKYRTAWIGGKYPAQA